MDTQYLLGLETCQRDALNITKWNRVYLNQLPPRIVSLGSASISNIADPGAAVIDTGRRAQGRDVVLGPKIVVNLPGHTVEVRVTGQSCIPGENFSVCLYYLA